MRILMVSLKICPFFPDLLNMSDNMNFEEIIKYFSFISIVKSTALLKKKKIYIYIGEK